MKSKSTEHVGSISFEVWPHVHTPIIITYPFICHTQHVNSITNYHSFDLIIKTLSIIIYQYIFTFWLTINWLPRRSCASLRRRSTSSVVSLPQCLDCVAWLDILIWIFNWWWNEMISVFGRFAWPFLRTAFDVFITILLEVTMPSPSLHPGMTWGTTSLGTCMARRAWRGNFRTSMMSAWRKQGSKELSGRARRIVQDILARYWWWRRMWRLRLGYNEEETRRNALWQMPIQVFRGFIHERLWK